MPAQLQFFDMSVDQAQPTYAAPVAITTGPNFQANDIRLVLQFVAVFGGSTDLSVTPPGYTDFSSGAATGMRCSYRRMVAGDTDTFIQYGTTTSFTAAFAILQVTVRGVSPSATPTPQAAVTVLTLPAASTTGGSVSGPTFSVPVGAGLAWANSFTSSGATTGCTWGAPAGWTNLVASPSSGNQYTPFGSQSSTILFAQAYSSAGTTPAYSIQYGAENGAHAYVMGVTLTAAADVSATAAGITTTTAITGATFSTSTAVTLPTGNINTVSSVSTAFNPLSGSWVSDALTLPGTPVTGSIVRWVSRTPLGTTCVIETSINNGASWDVATNNRGIPRLVEGDTGTQSVIARVTLTRSGASDPPPRVLSLELQVSSDSGVDELVAIGHGMIDKVTVHAVGGTTGSGSSTSVATSTAVASRGGGQTGSGTSIKVHVTDLSLSIKRNVWPMPYTIPGGLNYGDAVKAMVLNRLPSQTDFSIASTTAVLPEIVVFGLKQGGDPWQDIQDLATAIGYECFFDPRGVFTFRPVPDPRQGIPVWVFDEDANPVVVEASRELSDEQTFNHIVVEGQSTSSSNPVSAEAFDNDPSSQTYILGDYGEVTQRLTFPLVITQAQAQATANALLFNSLGAADTVTITCVPMPALEPGDIVKIKCSQVKANGTYMINSMTTSLSPADPQQLVCFRQSTNT